MIFEVLLSVYQLGNYMEAVRLHKKEASLSRDINDKLGLARSYGNHALVLKYQNDLDGALKLHQKELKICINIGDKKCEARSYGNQSLIYRRQKNIKKALTLLRKEEEIYTNYGYPALMMAHNLETQGLLLSDQKKFKKAIEKYKESEEVYESLGNAWGLATNYSNQAELLAKRLHKQHEGISFLKKAIRLARKTSDNRLKQIIT